MKNLKAFFFLGILVLSAALHAQDQQGYNEIFDQAGRVRPIYKEAYAVWSQLTDKDKATFLTQSRKAFQGDNALDAMPRIISAKEYDTVLKPGVDQRARAIRAFLQDYFSGLKLYSQYNVIPESVVQKLNQRSKEAGYAGLVNPNMISFMYGPDIIRDAQGTWRVIEDNTGFIGGIGDLALAQNFMKQEFPELDESFRFRSAETFYAEIAGRFNAEAKKNGGVAIMYMTTPTADNEDRRIRDHLAKYGIQKVTQHTNLQMKVTNDGVYLYDRRNPEKILDKVGYVMLNGEHWWLDPSYPVSYEHVVVGNAEDQLEMKRLKKSVRVALQAALAENPRDVKKIEGLLRQSNFRNTIGETMSDAKQARGLTQAALQGQVGLNFSPGGDFVGDKEFYLYVENMIRFYLKEKPILRNIPTERLGEVGTDRLNEEIFNRVFSDLSNYVVKKVDGRGGDAVWVGPKIQSKDIPALKERILKNPSEYIAQLYTPLSYMNDNIVDMRVIADVGPKSVFVTDTPWGRGLPKDGNGKVNLSDEGREVAILIHEGSWRMCKNVHLR